MKTAVIKPVSKWKPNLTYKDLQAVMQHFGSMPVFRTIIINRCNLSPTGLTGVTWKDTRLVFGVGMSEVSLRVRIPPEVGVPETFTKPFAVLIQLPRYPEDPDTWTSESWHWHVGTEAMFKNWLENCL